MMLVKRRRLNGFTLLELMIVIAIIAILASILVPNFLRARSRSQLTGCVSNLKNISTAVEMYYAEWDRTYPPSTSELTPNYLKTFPECPTAGSDTYSGSYLPETNPDRMVIYCEGNFHAAFAPTDYPQFNTGEGLVER
jgi:prepilin-type N-terminal cleavage/methylation domain-containing protein